MLFEVVGIVSTTISLSLVPVKRLCHHTEKIKTKRKRRGGSQYGCLNWGKRGRR
jgi:hypothetical protein